MVVIFAPERWGTLERFQHFCSTTYSFNHSTRKALSGAGHHFHKALRLLEIARQHATTLEEDASQLAECGYTPGRRGMELAALVESALLDLYSAVDCTRQVVTFIYKSHRGVRQRTRKFFRSARDGLIADTVPKELRDAFAGADWYEDFMRMRDELTHGDLGSCHLDKGTGDVVYMHVGLGTGRQALVVHDIISHVQGMVEQVNQFMGKVFHHLNQTLTDAKVVQMCGVFDARLYLRRVRPSEAQDFNSGRCESFKWFEKDGHTKCPFAATCQAYSRRLNDTSDANTAE